MVKYISIKGWNRKKWLKFREQGVGGSELCASITDALGDYGSQNSDPIKVHLEKIGEPVTSFTGNRFTKAGKHEEPDIADLYQYWDFDNPDPEVMFDNEVARNKLNFVRKVEAYIVDDRWPWLFASLDRRILRNKHAKVDFRRKGRGILECKNTTSMEKKRYKYGFNPDFYYQIMLYLMLTGFEYCDVAIKFDGNNFEVVTLEPRKDVFEFIEYHSARFWQNVLKCRQIKEEYKIDSYYGMPDYAFESWQMDGVALLQSLEPDLRGTESEESFIRDIIIPTPEYTKMPGTDKIWELAIDRQKHLDAKKASEREARKFNNMIIRELNGVHEAIFELPENKEAKVSYKPDARGVKKIYVSPAIYKGFDDEEA